MNALYFDEPIEENTSHFRAEHRMRIEEILLTSIANIRRSGQEIGPELMISAPSSIVLLRRHVRRRMLGENHF